MKKSNTFYAHQLPKDWKLRLLAKILKEDKNFCFFDSHQQENINYPHLHYNAVIAIGEKEVLEPKTHKWQALETFVEDKKNWKFGFLSYDLKNEIESLTSKNKDFVGFPELYFFKPETVITERDGIVEVLGDLSFDLNVLPTISTEKLYLPKTEFTSSTSKQQYLEQVHKLKQHIQRGDIYEINYCITFLANNYKVDPLALFYHFLEDAHVPFSSFCRINDHFIFSASPERFLKKSGTKVISQPIKGTSKRGNQPILEAKQLSDSLKDRTENVMIVDLVRNDLSRTAKRGSVRVEELFGIYSFPEVHQMISTVACEIEEHENPIEFIKKCFPMGSMTGAPKISAMQLAEEHENFKRGLYSGSIGFFTPDNNFDFNVVIRTAILNSKTKVLSYAVGGAITALSDNEQEFEECLLKAERFFKIFR